MNERSLDISSLDGTRLDASIVTPASGDSGTVLLIHGITAEKNEGGMYVRLASRLADKGIGSLRFSFRGHGKSDGAQSGLTIGGELADIFSAFHAVIDQSRPLYAVASSFGAVQLIALIHSLELPLEKIVFWNPVLDLSGTFLE